MALVTVQRSPSVVNSPHCSLSDIETEDNDDEIGESECFFAGKGTALILPTKDITLNAMERRHSTDSNKSTNSNQSNSSDIQQHLQQMFILLRREETLKMAVKLESQRPNRTRYLAIVSHSYYQNTNHRSLKKLRNKGSDKLIEMHKSINISVNVTERNVPADLDIKETSITTTQHKKKPSFDIKDVEESCLLGIDCNDKTTIGLVLPILADTTIHLDGDGGFSISVYNKTHIFKPVSVQAMWSALQSLHKVSDKARDNNFYAGGPSHTWVQYYESIIESERSCLNEWNTMDALESRRPPSPDAIRNKPSQKEEAERIIKMKLREIMMSVDLDEVTSKYIRSRLEELLNMDLNEYKSFIDKQMLSILGQMDAPTEIFEHVYLGSEWNASNLEELQKNGVSYILNVTREIDNFFPGTFKYLNIRVYDDEKTNLLKHWDNTFKFISEAKSKNSKILVHCKMGVSRSASVVVAYAMKSYNWDFNHALNFVKEKRSCIKPNKNFLTQLETYRGMLDAMKNKEKLQRSKSETNLKAAVKDARLLPGSEPTPLIQALNQSKNILCADNKESHRKVVRRSSSSSPKIVQNPIVTLKPQSQSLENLTPPAERASDDQQKNVRHTGSNGQNYSVTQNQILHIQKSASGAALSSSSHKSVPPKTTVKSLVNDLESGSECRKSKDQRKSLHLSNLHPHQIQDKDSKEETESTVTILKGPVWTSSSKIIHQSSHLFSNTFQNTTEDNLKNENKMSYVQMWQQANNDNNNFLEQTTISNRESSCSVDSAVIHGCSPWEKLDRSSSRHSSWNSEARVLPSRNSSWGSYDTNRKNFRFSNPAIVEGQVYNKIGIDGNNSFSLDRTYPGLKRTKLKSETFSSKDLNNFLAGKKEKCRAPQRCNSEEIILGFPLKNSQQLSVSAPEYSSTLRKTGDKKLNRSTSIVGSEKVKIPNNVQSLKKNFEAKVIHKDLTGKGNLLSTPSPTESNINVSTTTDNTEIIKNINQDSTDLSVKHLVNKYQYQSGSRTTQSNIYRGRPHSYYESRTSKPPDISITGGNSNLHKIVNNNDCRPPVPPMFKNSTTGNQISMTLSCRKVQQHGKTHPLTRLSKQKICNSPAYHTM